MKISRQRFNSTLQIARSGLALVAMAAVLAATLPIHAEALQKKTAKSGLSEQQRILHVLNRLGFGARPGDVERVRAIGVERYIEQQLNPAKISDEIAEDKVRDLPTLSMDTAELYAKYPQPGQLIRQLQRRGELPDELVTAQQNRKKLSVEPSVTPVDGSPTGRDEMPNSGTKPNGGQQNPEAAKDNAEYRRIIRDYYLQNGLKEPRRIIAELQASRILRAVYSERQLQEVLVDFWTNHFNVFAGKGADRWLLTSYDRDTIRPNTMGKFYDLLLATAQSPAMLFYLDNFQSVSPNASARSNNPNRRRGRGDSILGLLMGRQRQARIMDRDPKMRTGQVRDNQAPEQSPRQRRGINENYARELMELHTLGVDGGYTQKDVQEVARCFTGWTIFAPRGGGAALAVMGAGARENAGKFYFNARMHDDGEKTVLGQKIPAGGGMKDGLKVLDILSRHPSTAKFIATKLTRFFVQDSPPPGLVDRVAAQFTKSDGDIRETLKAIFFSPEFNSAVAYRAKVKRPFELAISSIRTLGAETNGGPQLHQWIARMGEPLYFYQTPNGYSDAAESWVNSGGLLERLNFGLSLASNRIPGTRVDLKRFVGDGSNGQAVDSTSVMDRFLNLIVGGEISSRTRETLLKQLEQETSAPSQLGAVEPANERDSLMGPNRNDVQSSRRRQQLARADAAIADPASKIVGLILGSPEFQRQ